MDREALQGHKFTLTAMVFVAVVFLCLCLARVVRGGEPGVIGPAVVSSVIRPLAVRTQAVKASPAVTPIKPKVVKSCPCSDACVCGCNDGQPCRCLVSRGTSESPGATSQAFQASQGGFQAVQRAPAPVLQAVPQGSWAYPTHGMPIPGPGMAQGGSWGFQATQTPSFGSGGLYGAFSGGFSGFSGGHSAGYSGGYPAGCSSGG